MLCRPVLCCAVLLCCVWRALACGLPCAFAAWPRASQPLQGCRHAVWVVGWSAGRQSAGLR